MKFTIIEATGPVWANPEMTLINLQVKFAEFEEVLPFTASPDDSEEHGRFLFEQAASGAYGEVAAYDGPTREEQDAALFQYAKQAAMASLEQSIAPLERARRLGVATEQELKELTALEVYSINLLRAEGPELPAMVATLD